MNGLCGFTKASLDVSGPEIAYDNSANNQSQEISHSLQCLWCSSKRKQNWSYRYNS